MPTVQVSTYVKVFLPGQTCYKNKKFQPILKARYLAFLYIRLQLFASLNIRTVCVTLCQYESVNGDVTANTGLAME